MTDAPKAAALAFALTLGAPPAGGGDCQTEIMAQAIEPCFRHVAQQCLAEGRSPQAMARAMMPLQGEALAKPVDGLDSG